MLCYGCSVVNVVMKGKVDVDVEDGVANVVGDER